MDNFLSSRKIIWFCVIVGLLAVVAVIVVTMMNKNKVASNTTNGNNAAPVKIDVKNVAPDKLPDKFPTDMPMEAGATVTQNKVETTTDGRFQATRSFTSKAPIADSFKIYQTYFQKTGWTITSTIQQPTYQAVSATKGNLNAQISINDNSVTKQKTVTIYLVQKVAAQ